MALCWQSQDRGQTFIVWAVVYGTDTVYTLSGQGSDLCCVDSGLWHRHCVHCQDTGQTLSVVTVVYGTDTLCTLSGHGSDPQCVDSGLWHRHTVYTVRTRVRPSMC